MSNNGTTIVNVFGRGESLVIDDDVLEEEPRIGGSFPSSFSFVKRKNILSHSLKYNDFLSKSSFLKALLIKQMDNNPSSPTSLTFSANQKVPKLNQRQLTEIDTGNYSTGSLGHDQAATTNDASNSRIQLPEVPTDATYTKRESKSRLTSTPLMDRETYNLGHTGDQNYHRQYDQNYGDEATRHNTLTSGYPNHYENEYNDIDFPVVVKMHVNI